MSKPECFYDEDERLARRIWWSDRFGDLVAILALTGLGLLAYYCLFG